MNSTVPQTNATDLSQLRDIHLPPPISWWPPAPGWWLLAGLISIALIAAIFWLINYRRKNRYRRLALQQLRALHARWQTQQDDAQLVEAINQLLKQTALIAYPRRRVAALSGADWLLFLDSGLNRPRFSEAALRGLATAYQAAPAAVAPELLLSATEYWIRRHRC